MPLLAHKIALASTPAQNESFGRAAGTARFVWNWGLDAWNQQDAQGRPPNAADLKKQLNAQRYAAYPWLREIHRDAHAEPFAPLAAAWTRFLADLKAGKPAHAPRFKKKGRCEDSVCVANDKFTLDGQRIRLARVGWIVMTEELRFAGNIMGATVSRRAQRWDVGFGRIRAQLRYKAALYGTHLVMADPWYPSSKWCSTPGCDFKHQDLKLSERSWLCPRCGVRHDRDINAALNLKRLATATALPVAKLAGNGAAGEGKVPSLAGKVTSVRDERGAMRSGQKKSRAHLCALS